MNNASLDSLSLESYTPDCHLLTSLDEEQHPREDEELGDSCIAAWDSVLCWPRTKAGNMAVQPCFDELHGIRYDVSREYKHTYVYIQSAILFCVQGRFSGYTARILSLYRYSREGKLDSAW